MAVDVEKFTADEMEDLFLSTIKSLIESLDLKKFQQCFLANYQHDNANEVLSELMTEFNNHDDLQKEVEEIFDTLGFKDIPPEESEEG